MDFAVISDIHGNLVALEAVLADLQNVGEPNLIWCLGDLAANGPRPSECIQRVFGLIEQYGEEKVKIIGGNTDRYLVTGERFKLAIVDSPEKFDETRRGIIGREQVYHWNMQQLAFEDYERLSKILHRELRHHVPGYGTVIGFHAIPGDDEPTNLRPDSSDEEALDAMLDRQGVLAFTGHTHHAMDRWIGHWRVVNPGSVGLSASNPGVAEWAWVRIVDGEATVDLRQVPFDHDAIAADLEESGYPNPENFLEMIRG